MNDDQLLRYSRHILLDEIGIDGQQRWLDARALVVGAGGLGSPVALYLAASGVGQITLCDPDVVDLTNLQRQIIHRTDAIGQAKVVSARDTLAGINPGTRVEVVQERVSGDQLDALVRDADIVLDCCDNFATRHAVNRACVKHGRPLVSGAGIRFDGQVAVFDPRDAESPCYHCLFPETGNLEEMRCAVMGVFAPLVGIIGAVQAAEALKVLAGIGESLEGRLLMLDAMAMQWRSVRVRRDPACSVCGGDRSLLRADTTPVACELRD
jgi:molybdopterin/thiamine biosynthesis adenylyltransferase